MLDLPLEFDGREDATDSKSSESMSTAVNIEAKGIDEKKAYRFRPNGQCPEVECGLDLFREALMGVG
jgi:hypothetical protein